MEKYRNDRARIRALVQPDRVHRDVYVDPELFELEMERLWPRSWIYVGHDSQVANAGDYVTTELARRPVIMVRDTEGRVRVLMNRCAHKGAKVVGAASGNCRGTFRCPYHGWTFRTDGSLRTVPAKGVTYTGTSFDSSEAARGMVEVKNVAVYRGFVFARLAADGPAFEEYFGESLSSIDNMADRSPVGRLEYAGGALRYEHDCNWKMFVENLNDTMHPMVAHESSAGTAKTLWGDRPADEPKPMVIEQFLPFVSNYDFFDRMGVKTYDHGHSYTGVNFSIHSKYSAIPEYEAAMVAAYGEERAHRILAEARHNTVYYPSLTIKGAIQAIRVVRPIAVNRTIIESHTFRLVGAPDVLLERSVMYTRLINAPTSVVGHDDLHCYRAIQQGLTTEGNDWVNLQRNYSPDEKPGVHNGLSEISVRAEFRAWVDGMTAGEGA